MSASATSIRSARPQTAASVLDAESRRLRVRGGMPVGIVVALVTGTLAGVAALLVLRSLTATTTHVVATTPLEMGGLLAALVMAIATASLIGRDGAGQLALALSLTPRRALLHWSRATAFATTGAIVTGAAVIVPAVVGVAVTGGGSVGWAALGVLLIALAGGWLALLAFGLATLARRGGPAVLILVGLLIVLPLVLGSVGGLLPPAVAGLAETAVRVCPTTLFIEAVAVSTVPSQGIAGVLAGQAGLATWACVAGVISGSVFHRRDA